MTTKGFGFISAAARWAGKAFVHISAMARWIGPAETRAMRYFILAGQGMTGAAMRANAIWRVEGLNVLIAPADLRAVTQGNPHCVNRRAKRAGCCPPVPAPEFSRRPSPAGTFSGSASDTQADCSGWRCACLPLIARWDVERGRGWMLALAALWWWPVSMFLYWSDNGCGALRAGNARRCWPPGSELPWGLAGAHCWRSRLLAANSRKASYQQIFWLIILRTQKTYSWADWGLFDGPLSVSATGKFEPQTARPVKAGKSS